MPRVIEVIRRLFPMGTVAGRRKNWNRPPFWPPDLFAVTATLVSMSGCYSRACYTAHWSESCFFNNHYLNEVRDAGKIWGEGRLPPLVKTLWASLIEASSQEVAEPDGTWCDPAMKLMSIADEASAGIGFVESGKSSIFADYVIRLHRYYVLKRRALFDGPRLPITLCWMVPPSEVCVQPKARTPQVGCTLRSLSHHLALLPPVGDITTSWMFGVAEHQLTDRVLNLLLVPFPFRIDASCFVGEPGLYGEGEEGFFSIRQNWLRKGASKLSSREVASFLLGLLTQAKREVNEVHGLILPEAALQESQLAAISKDLAAKTKLELFISGFIVSGRKRTDLPKNKVYTSIFYKKHIFVKWLQSKHHRWRLDRDQIRRYHLGDSLNPEQVWWEKIELEPRTCYFYVFRHGASLAALVCEDLARIDPAQAALRSVGPNLLVVLLMDGPQLEKRWPGKYATVLADDPGSAVLTLTSLGMVRRSIMPGDEEPREIALWKEPGGFARELKLPRGSHALLLTLSQSKEKNFSLDGRSDEGTTVRLSLSGVHAISHPDPRAWLH